MGARGHGGMGDPARDKGDRGKRDSARGKGDSVRDKGDSVRDKGDLRYPHAPMHAPTPVTKRGER